LRKKEKFISPLPLRERVRERGDIIFVERASPAIQKLLVGG